MNLDIQDFNVNDGWLFVLPQQNLGDTVSAHYNGNKHPGFLLVRLTTISLSGQFTTDVA